MDTFAERLNTARKAAKLSQIQLAAKSGLSQTTISNIESGRNASSRDIISIAKALKVSADWLATGQGEMARKNGENPMFDRFTWVYDHITDEGKKFLENAVNVAAVTYLKTGKDAGK